MQVERERGFGPEYSGGRVRNTWIICPSAGDNSPKGLLIPHTSARPPGLAGKEGARKGLSPEDESAAHQLVGGVTAHQGEDG